MIRVRPVVLAVAAAAAVALSAGLTLAPASAAPLPGRHEVFVGDYDTGDFCQWRTLQNAGACGYDQTHYSAEVVDGGGGHPTAARFELRDGDVPDVPGGERAEVRAGRAGDVVEGDERWYEFSLRFADDFPDPTGSYMVVMQWHPVSGPPPLAVEVDGAGNLIVRNAVAGATSRVVGRIKRGQWADYVLHVSRASTATWPTAARPCSGTTVCGCSRPEDQAARSPFTRSRTIFARSTSARSGFITHRRIS